MDKLKKILESKTFKYASYVFWVIYFGAVFYVVDIEISGIIDSLMYEGEYGYNNPAQYALSYKTIKLLSLPVSRWEVYIAEAFSLWCVIVIFSITLMRSFIRKLIFRKKVPIFWLISIFTGTILFLFVCISDKYF